jgi:hypothetical protein
MQILFISYKMVLQKTGVEKLRLSKVNHEIFLLAVCIGGRCDGPVPG